LFSQKNLIFSGNIARRLEPAIERRSAIPIPATTGVAAKISSDADVFCA